MKPPYILTIVRGAATYLYDTEGVRDRSELLKHGRLTSKQFNSLEEMNAFSLGFELGQRDPQALLADDLT